MADLTELTTPLTKAEVEAAIYSTLNALGVTTTSWKSGAVARTIIAGVSIVLASMSSLQQRIAESGFLELSSGDWLELVARLVYDVEKDDGTFATGNVQLDNTGGGLFNVAIGDLVVLNTASSKTYRNTAAFTLNPLQTGLLVPVRAEEIGAASTANPGAIDDFVTVLLNVTVTNPTALVGSDEETDADLRARCLAKTGVLSPNGPGDAYRFLALSAKRDDGATVDVTRVTTVADGSGNVTVTVGSATGVVSGTIGDTTTDLGAVDEAIQTQAVPLAVTATIQSATALSVDVTATVWVRNTVGLTASELQTKISTALTNYLATSPIGGFIKVAPNGFVFVDALEGVISETVGSSFLVDVEVTTPAADVAVATTEAPVGGTFSVTVNLVDV